MKVLLVATYELGRQPFGLASPAAWLADDGFDVRCLDLAVESFDEPAVREADLVAFHVPMHTATRLAAHAVERVKELNPRARLCFYGLYASLNESYLRGLGGETILGGEFETGLRELARRLREGRPETGTAMPVVSLERQDFRVPDRRGLPDLDRYASLRLPSGERRTVGYTEASRGCKHVCRHCPVVPVYGGRFRVVPPEVVLEDVRAQVARGARHVTFGDPDFLNGPKHAIRVVEGVHSQFPELTYDVTVKVEHLLRHADLLRLLRESGCLFVTTAVESFDDEVLRKLDKGHTRADVFAVADAARRVGLDLNPTFLPFTPWQTPRGYRDLLETVAELGWIEHVAPVQYSIRLLITAGSRLLELEDVRERVGPFDEERLAHPWTHADPGVDRLHAAVLDLIHDSRHLGHDREGTLHRLAALAGGGQGGGARGRIGERPRLARAAVPYLTEPWYC